MTARRVTVRQHGSGPLLLTPGTRLRPSAACRAGHEKGSLGEARKRLRRASPGSRRFGYLMNVNGHVRERDSQVGMDVGQGAHCGPPPWGLGKDAGGATLLEKRYAPPPATPSGLYHINSWRALATATRELSQPRSTRGHSGHWQESVADGQNGHARSSWRGHAPLTAHFTLRRALGSAACRRRP